MPKSIDQKIYQKIIQSEQDNQQAKPKSYASAFLVHAVLKAIPFGLLFFDSILAALFSQLVVNQLVIIFTVVQFWFTKNVSGKRMLGLRWFFEDDIYGVQRANTQHIDPMKSKLFWIVQIIYCVLTVLFVVGIIFLIPNAVRLDFRKFSLNALMLLSGGSNLFFFYKASSAASEKQSQLRSKLGVDFIRKLGLCSIVSHI